MKIDMECLLVHRHTISIDRKGFVSTEQSKCVVGKEMMEMDRSSLEPLSISILVNLKLQDYAHNLTQSHKHILIISQSKHESKCK